MTGNGAFVDAELKRITGFKQKSAKLIHYRADERTRLAIERRTRKTAWLGFVFSILVTALMYIVGNVVNLKNRYSYAYAWYDGVSLKGATSSVGRNNSTLAFGYLRGPPPEGPTHYSIMCCAISAEYHPLLKALSLVSVCPTINRAGAIFLLTFAQRYSNEIEGIHWNGSKQQLHYTSAQQYVSNWTSWNVTENPWRWLYPQRIDFELSEAISSAHRAWTSSYLNSLFSGGLCQLVMDQTSDTSDATTMIQHLMGIKLVLFRSCRAERLHNAVQNAVHGAMAAGSIVGLSNAYRAATATAASREAVTAAMRTSMSISGDIASTGQVAQATADATAAARASAVGSTVATVDAAGETAGVAVGEAAGAEAAAALGASVDLPVVSGCAAFLIFAPLCAFIGITVSTLIITAVVVGAVGAITGAATFASATCPKGQYYVMVDNKSIPWDGDVSVLPKGAQRARSSPTNLFSHA